MNQKDSRYNGEIPYWDDCWFRAHEEYIANLPENAEALPIDASQKYYQKGELFQGRSLLRKIIPGDIFAIVSKV
jgi:hypothetical protein